MAHEFKHVLDHTVARIAYAQLGQGDVAKHDQQVEWVCQFFAACLLMPRTWVKRAWVKRAWTSGIQDEKALAGLFKVSVEAAQAPHLPRLPRRRPPSSRLLPH